MHSLVGLKFLLVNFIQALAQQFGPTRKQSLGLGAVGDAIGPLHMAIIAHAPAIDNARQYFTAD